MGKLSTDFVDKYRPKIAAQLIGAVQRNVAETLLEKIATEKRLQPTMLVGGSGTGKTTIGMMLADALGEFGGVEWNEINCGADGKIDNIRAIIDSLTAGSFFGNNKVYFFDEIHNLPSAGQEALLKPLEPLPPNVTVIAATTDSDRTLKDTFKSRFSIYHLATPTRTEQLRLVNTIAKRENIELTETDKATILTLADGNVRALVRLLEQKGQGLSLGVQETDVYEQSFMGLLLQQPQPDFRALLEIEVDSYQSMPYTLGTWAMNRIKRGDRDTRLPVIIQVLGRKPMPQTNIEFYSRLVDLLDKFKDMG